MNKIIEEIGQEVYIYGISSGGALVLEALKTGIQIKKAIIYEVPFITDNSREPLNDTYFNQLEEFIQQNKPSMTVKHFMNKGIGLNKVIVFMMTLMPTWKKLKSLYKTVIYDTMLIKNYTKGTKLIEKYWEKINIPVCVVSGSKSEKWIQNSMKNLSDILPNSKYISLNGQTHIVNPKSLVPIFNEFFN